MSSHVYGLASKPIYDGACDKLGHIVLDKVTSMANGEQGPIVL
jgi:hypothetical protein